MLPNIPCWKLHAQSDCISGDRTPHPRELLIRCSNVAEYEIKANSPYQPMNSLSGGHQQRCMISRELLNKPRLILAHNPTRGLDIRASRFVHEALHSACARGTGMILFSSELSELFLLCHRIGVLCGGWLREIRNREHWDMEALGRVMAGAPQ